ncbi:MAG: hypothetical protein K0S47_2016 [Herbinix sp.]|nr:hypothetical protein [Herbinix sp.]
MKSKIAIVGITLFFMISIIMHVMRGVHDRKEEQVFLNHTFAYLSTIYSSLTALEEYYNTDTNDNLNSEVSYLLDYINSLDQILTYGKLFVDQSIPSSGVEFGFGTIKRTIEGKLLTSNKKYQVPFTEDFILSKQEYQFLNELKTDVKEVLDGMTGENEKIVKNLSLNKFNHLLEDFFDKWDIYPERTPSGVSPYDLLWGIES